MPASRLDQPKPTDDTTAKAAEKVAAAAPVARKGGNSWVPLIANIILMPAVAYALTTFVLIPKIQGGKADGVSAEHSDEGGKNTPKTKVSVPLGGKVLVNVSGTAGTRYLVANITLVGKKPDLKEKVESADAELRDAAASILGIKTISDLEKPGMRNIIRSELIAAFNDILGKESITDIYLTEFAVQ
jgi:flagellar FliL protein